MRRVQANKWAEQCDRDNAEKVLEVARALDEREAEMAAFAARASLQSNFERVSFGPIIARKTKVLREPRSGWQEDDDNWDFVYADYQKLKGTPMSSDWLEFNRDAQSLLDSDESRVIKGDNYGLRYDSKGWLTQAHEVFLSCIQDESCVEPLWTAELKSLLNENGYFYLEMGILEKATSSQDRRFQMGKMSRQFEAALEDFTFKKITLSDVRVR